MSRFAQGVDDTILIMPRAQSRLESLSLPPVSPSSSSPHPSVPRLMGYCHVGHGVRLGANGTLSIGRSTADSADWLGEGRSGLDVLQQIASEVRDGPLIGTPRGTLYLTFIGIRAAADRQRGGAEE
jgi:hypothetical protein